MRTVTEFRINARKLAVRAGLVLSVLGMALSVPAYSRDVQPPTKPPNFTAKVVAANAVELSWDESIDDNDVVDYQLLRNGIRVTKTDAVNFTDKGLEPGTEYRYDVIANDGTNSSYVSTVTVTIPVVQ